MSSWVEKLWPFGAAVVAGVATAFVEPPTEGEPLARYVSAGTMALGLIVAGFTATQRNMLLGMGGAKVLRYAATTGYYKDVLGYLAQCIYAGLIVTLASMIGIFIDNCCWVWPLWLALWVGSIVLVVALLIRNEWLMARIFTRFMEEQKRSKPTD